MTPLFAFLLTALLVACLCVRLLLCGNCKRTEWMLVAALFYLVYGAAYQWLLTALARAVNVRYDSGMLALDNALGGASAAMRSLVHTHSWAAIMAAQTYQALLTLALGAFALLLWWQSMEAAAEYAAAMLVNLALAVPLYLMFPVSGPAYAAAPLAAPPNGVPSVHMSTALLIAWSLRRTRWCVLGWLFAGLMAFATLGTGEHYLLDLLCAVPYAMLVLWLVQRKPVAAVAIPVAVTAVQQEAA